MAKANLQHCHIQPVCEVEYCVSRCANLVFLSCEKSLVHSAMAQCIADLTPNLSPGQQATQWPHLPNHNHCQPPPPFLLQ